MDALRVGFVGLGWWGRELAEAARRTEGAVVPVAGFSPDQAEAEAFAARFRARPTGSFAGLLADPGIEAVVLATPHSLHADQIVAAARAGKHVFVEKPLTLTTADARRALDACRAAGVTLAVGHNRRLLAQLDILSGLLDDGVAGRIGLVEANFSTAEALGLPPGHWRRDPRECPGGAMTALGVHLIDWLHALFGRVAEVQARFACTTVAPPMQDAATAILAFESGVVATLTCLYAAPYANRFVVHGSAARITVEAAAPESVEIRPSVTIARPDGTARTVDVPHVDTLALQLARWAGACRGEATVTVTGVEAARNVAVLEAIARAADSGTRVAPDYAAIGD